MVDADFGGGGEPGGQDPAAEEMLRRLEERLLRASEAAERLMRTAAERAGGETAHGPLRPQDLELLSGAWERLTDLVPPELQRRVAEALRELLLAVRAMIDWYLERLEHRPTEAPEVKDIPIL